MCYNQRPQIQEEKLAKFGRDSGVESVKIRDNIRDKKVLFY